MSVNFLFPSCNLVPQQCLLNLVRWSSCMCIMYMSKIVCRFNLIRRIRINCVHTGYNVSNSILLLLRVAGSQFELFPLIFAIQHIHVALLKDVDDGINFQVECDLCKLPTLVVCTFQLFSPSKQTNIPRALHGLSSVVTLYIFTYIVFSCILFW